MKNSVSLCMIVSNEEKNIGRCLASVAGAVDEIIVIDTGSTDRTKEIAVQHGARVQSFLWNDNFSDARNASLEMASGEWILFLDADEELTPGSVAILRRLVADENMEGYFVKIINYLGSEGWTDSCSDLVFRLFRNRPQYRFHGAVCEQIADVILEKNRQTRWQAAVDVVILHYGYMSSRAEGKEKKKRNLAIIQREISLHPDDPLLRYHYGVELFRLQAYEQAAEELTHAACGLDPQTIYLPKLIRYIILAYYAAHRYAAALEAVGVGIKLFPDYADLYYYGGLISYETKQYGQACRHFHRALASGEQPVYFAPLSGTRGFRSYYYLGLLAETFLQNDKALHYYVMSLRDNPFFSMALESAVRVVKPRDDPDKAREGLEKLFDFCSPQACRLIARILFRQSAFGLALEYLEQGQGQEDTAPEIALWKAICLIQAERHFEALRILGEIDASHYLYPLAKLNELISYWLQRQPQKVRNLSEELFSIGLSTDTGAVVGLLRDSLGKRSFLPLVVEEDGFALFLDVVTRALDLGKNDLAEALLAGLAEPFRRENALALGQIFFQFGNMEKAEVLLSEVLANCTGCDVAYQLLAQIRERQGRLEDAAALYRQAIMLNPREPAYYVRLIRLYGRMRREILKDAVEKYPENTVFHSQLEALEQNEARNDKFGDDRLQ